MERLMGKRRSEGGSRDAGGSEGGKGEQRQTRNEGNREKEVKEAGGEKSAAGVTMP